MAIIKSHSVSSVCIEMVFSIYNWLEILRKMGKEEGTERLCGGGETHTDKLIV